MKKTKTAKKTAIKKTTRFFERRAPDLPFWIFLTLGALALTTFASWLKNPTPIKPPSTSLTAPTSPTTPTKTITLTNASDPSLVAKDGKIYLTFRNNVGGYSVAVYDASLTELEAPRWITNGFAIPNQQVAAPIFAGENWYLAFLGGDGYTRLAKYDANWNPQRSITFRTALTSLKTPSISSNPSSEAVIVIVYDKDNGHLFSASLDLGLILDQKYTGETGTFYPSVKKPLTLDTKTYQAETSGTSVVLKM